MTFFTDRLDDLVKERGELPPVVRTLQFGTLDEWSEGRAFKRWTPNEDVLNADGSMFGGYIAASCRPDARLCRHDARARGQRVPHDQSHGAVSSRSAARIRS